MTGKPAKLHLKSAKLRLGVLASGRGSNLQAIIDASERGELDAAVSVVISDRKDAEALGRAARHGIEGVWLDPKSFPDRAAYDRRVIDILRERRVDLVVLAGYMRIVGRAILDAFPGRVMNIHPALLPSFPGKDAQRQAVEHGVKVSGCTVHFVDEGTDTGPIIIQKAVPVAEGETAEELADRILAEEHRIYPQAIQLFAEGRLRVVDGRRVEVLPPRGTAAVAAATGAAGASRGGAAGRGGRRRALLSVHDKTGLVEFARGLVEAGFDLVSSGGTAKAIRGAGLPVTPVEEVTGFPEMLDGRVKTLHPAVHGGLLARRDLPAHLVEIERHGIRPIDLVAVNLYPFQATVNRQAAGSADARAWGASAAGDNGGGPATSDSAAALAEAVENIDIGGPTLIRSAAKNHAAVVVVTDPSQYGTVLGYLRDGGDVPPAVRRELALAAFRHTAFYDAVISEYLAGVVARDRGEAVEVEREGAAGEAAEVEREAGTGAAAAGAAAAPRFPERLVLAYEKVSDLRYGENPHQKAAFYRHPLRRVLDELGATLPGAAQLQGKELSYNNIADAEAALRCVEEFSGGGSGPDGELSAPAAVAVKHMNPCGVAVAPDILTAYRLAFDSDPVSIFGGIVALNRPVEEDLAAELARIFLEVVLAPSFSPAALKVLAKKPDLRLLALPVGAGVAGGAGVARARDGAATRPSSAVRSGDPGAVGAGFEARSVAGGLLVQTPDRIEVPPTAWKPVTARRPTEAELRDLFFAWRVVKHVKSNAIAVAKNGQLLGVGAGQMNRVDSVRLAVGHAGERAQGAVLASDAFFPFPDSVEVAAAAGVTAIVQPGGSLRDAESVKAADAAGMAMVVTAERHFKH